MQARWLFSDAVMGKRLTIEVISKVCIQYTYVCYQTSHEMFTTIIIMSKVALMRICIELLKSLGSIPEYLVLSVHF